MAIIIKVRCELRTFYGKNAKFESAYCTRYCSDRRVSAQPYSSQGAEGLNPQHSATDLPMLIKPIRRVHTVQEIRCIEEEKMHLALECAEV